ncbi:MAG: hypothetical protein J6K50_00255 [Clostridia bacterium]|nr:hypothetical protein [Clostridia bacterium]
MKAKKNNAPAQEPVVAMPVNTQQEWVINCNRCGAALNVKNDGNAYICPVCNTLFRIHTGTRIVKDLSQKEKQVHLTLTEKAVNLIVENEEKAQRKAAKKKRKPSLRRQKKARKKLQRALETVMAQNIRLSEYEEGDVLLVDLDDEGLVVKRPQA